MNLAKTSDLLRKSIFGGVGSLCIIRTKHDPDKLLGALEGFNIVGEQLRARNYISAWIPRFALKHVVELPFVDRVYLDTVARIPEIRGGFMPFQLLPDIFRMARGRPTVSLLTEQAPGWISTEETRKAMEADIAEQQGVTGRGVKIAIVDTEAGERYAQHPQLASAVIARMNFTPSPTDENGHGGHCSTIAAGRPAISVPNKIKVKGVAPGASIIAAKCLATPMGVGQTSWIVNAMQWSLEQGADILSMSLGGPIQTPDPQVDFIAEHKGDAIYVVAAGNEGPLPSTLSSPGHSPQVITVGSIGLIDHSVAFFSSRGPTPDGAIKPDVVAPGGGRSSADAVPEENIYSGVTYQTLLDREADMIGNGYTAIAGTSMATPHVAGFMALLLEGKMLGEDRAQYADQFKTIMSKQQSKSNSSGWGMPKWSLFAEV